MVEEVQGYRATSLLPVRNNPRDLHSVSGLQDYDKVDDPSTLSQETDLYGEENLGLLHAAPEAAPKQGALIRNQFLRLMTPTNLESLPPKVREFLLGLDFYRLPLKKDNNMFGMFGVITEGMEAEYDRQEVMKCLYFLANHETLPVQDFIFEDPKKGLSWKQRKLGSGLLVRKPIVTGGSALLPDDREIRSISDVDLVADEFNLRSSYCPEPNGGIRYWMDDFREHYPVLQQFTDNINALREAYGSDILLDSSGKRKPSLRIGAPVVPLEPHDSSDIKSCNRDPQGLYDKFLGTNLPPDFENALRRSDFYLKDEPDDDGDPFDYDHGMGLIAPYDTYLEVADGKNERLRRDYNKAMVAARHNLLRMPIRNETSGDAEWFESVNS